MHKQKLCSERRSVNSSIGTHVVHNEAQQAQASWPEHGLKLCAYKKQQNRTYRLDEKHSAQEGVAKLKGDRQSGGFEFALRPAIFPLPKVRVQSMSMHC